MTIQDFISDELVSALDSLVKSTHLLVATDFDGTIAHLVDDPIIAQLEPLAAVAIRKLCDLPQTDVCIISGRALVDLHSKFAGLDKVRLVGSHGSEFDLGVVTPLSPAQLQLLKSAANLVEASCARVTGSTMELKPHSVVWHYRRVDDYSSRLEAERLSLELKGLNDGCLRLGSAVIEYSAVENHKGEALERIRNQLGPTSVLFIGDDVSDEDAFKHIGPNSVSIKVGPGDSLASYQLRDSKEVGEFLALLAQRRELWFGRQPETPIDEHAFLSDLRTCVLLDAQSTVVWFCAPRIDSAPLFGALVGGPGSGHFTLRGLGQIERNYLDDTMILESKWPGLILMDFLACEGGRAFQRAGRSDFRRILRGSGQIEAEFAPRIDFGRVTTRLKICPEGLIIEGGQYPCILLSPGWTWEITREGDHDTARSRRLLSNEQISLDLLCGTGVAHETLKSSELSLQETIRFWRMWVESLHIPETVRGPLVKSALVIRALSYGPTGALAGAATTSLPETVGGVRNWDYRLCWPRDAAMACSALTKLGATGMGLRFLDWIIAITENMVGDAFLAPVYSVAGGQVTGEADIAEALGYRLSRPVRVGNLAAQQLQLDVFGPVTELLANLVKLGAAISVEHLALLDRIVSLIEKNWQEPDSGIWEIRGARRHYVHSKVMCWYAVEQALKVANALGFERRRWTNLASEIRSSIEKNGYSESLGSYMAAYDLAEADAAVLWVALSGFHAPSDPRLLSTVRFLKEKLLHKGCMYRYHYDDGIPGREGAFHICLAWMIEALSIIGEHKDAKELCQVFLKRAGSLGLFSEQWEPTAGIALGNFPQVYSHLGLINAVLSSSGVPASQ